MPTPVIPEYITVHLGAPDAPARNITVPFTDYIKNVASSEIYPTWPEAALRANILAQISFAMNRIYTEWYRSQGYDFDITNSTQYDQSFRENRDFFENISLIVDDIFNDYVVQRGSIVPYFTRYCAYGACGGLSQWGSVGLAEEGLVAYEILQRYYGDDIDIVFNAPVGGNIESYPGLPLRLGDVSEEVRTIQRELNRIGINYPSIPRISEVEGIFNTQTEAAVRKFQDIFNLTVDGIVGKATWYKLKYIYSTVKRLSDLESEGIALSEAQRLYEKALGPGDRGDRVKVVQYFLAIVATFDDEIPSVNVDGIYDANTEDAVRAFQQSAGIAVDGIVGRDTWNALKQRYQQTLAALPPEYAENRYEIFPGRYLSIGQSGEEVRALQRFLIGAREVDPSIPAVTETGTFDAATDAAVRYIQQAEGLPVNGAAGPLVWARVVQLYKESVGRGDE